MSQEIDLINDTHQDSIDDRSEPAVEFDPEVEQMHEKELRNLRVLELLHDLTADPKETILTVQDIDQTTINYISHDNTESNWVASDGPLRVPAFNLDLLKSGTTERGRNRLMRWRRREMSEHDLALVPGLGEQRVCRLGEMLKPVRPSYSAQPLFGSKRSRDEPAPLHSVDSPTAAPPPKKVRMNDIEIQTAETSETLEKKGQSLGRIVRQV